MKSKVSVSFMMLGVLFCTCLVASNLLETKVVRLWQMPGGHILSVTAGLLVFPISYIINDCIAEVWGYRKARLIIWLGFAMNFLVIILSRVAVMLPAAPFWEGEEAFNFVFGLAPRIAAASLLAFLVGSFLNAYVMSRMKIRSAGRNFSARAILSTLVGESADSLLFFPIAFGGIIPADELLKMIAVQALLKTLYEILILPVTIRVVHYIKRVDETDTYDEGISYNVWKIKEL
ncbi:hypothetical protein C7123_07385 [Tannerella serpentiformis]|jgi:hypothetical protein|uniref:Probable queuosine precursor transporter n=4 Tax=Tannerella serpentiformis TaxID=712710 RepID=W2CGA0_9BACT|nr:queuosine precursor transporter [Tannerella serpentiformis]ETK00717.1 membrane protein [Tannerella sp. oral taxon BU063 isolate Cell 2]ETK06120.1 membrane protein [Tannerella sp. oral taxon BU063 isolate Cell 1/3]RKW64069.1 MAG: VUT family protein [Tannerella sp.]AOH41809.1 hypothetical protein BCB71_12260 [Tannerella serpentiformis]AVV53550.1 hypothetical protein C7123_07385 [Tannerella serpentiformis]